jgi:hypothetical protein
MAARTLVVVGALAAVCAPACLSGQAAGRGFPSPMDDYVRTVARLTPADTQALLAGRPVATLLATDNGREVAVFSAIWIGASVQRYVDAVDDIESFERGGGFLVTKRLSDPPRLEDFAQLNLPDEDMSDLETCKVGDCEVKLSRAFLDELRAHVDWSKPTAHADVQAMMRRAALEFVNGYLEAGNDKLSVYRDADDPTFVATEFRSMIDRLPELADRLPDLRRYLLDYPRVTLPGGTSFLYWQNVDFGLKPTIRINHVVVQRKVDSAVVCTKMLYASHYFWTALDLRVLVPDPERGTGFWLLTVGRSRSDGLTGFVGHLIRSKVRREAVDGALSALSSTKARLEAPF